MRLRVPLFILAALAFFVPLRANAAAVSICNSGNVTMNVARAIYSKSFFFGNSYRVSGWYEVEPHKCAVIYSEEDPEAIYLGFTYPDVKNTLRTFDGSPDTPDDLMKAVSEQFCAGIGVPFDYKTTTKGGACRDGFSPLEFTLYLGLDDGNWGRVSYTLGPNKFNTSRTAFNAPPAPTAVGKLMMGGEVQLAGNIWRLPEGSPVGTSLINPQRKLPPLGPKQQYSVARAPVAGYIKQITDVLTAAPTCNNGYLNKQVTHHGFAMDDRGVVVSANTTYSDKEEQDDRAMAIGDMDLANAAPVDRGGCWELGVYCKDQSYCGQHNKLPDATTTVGIEVYVDNKDQAIAILNALKGMVPYYPDAAPEIHQLK